MSLASTAPGLISRTKGYLRASGFFDEGGTVDAYLAFEAALAEVEGDLGIIPKEAVAPIVSICRRDLIDMDALRDGAVAVGYPIVPLVSMLAEMAGEHGQWVHYGTTTQDVMDTAQVLQMRGALAEIFSNVQEVEELLAELCQNHKETPMAGRSKLQHGVPISFGYKSAVWLDQIQRTREGVQRALSDASMLQFGGAIGTLASLQGAGLNVRSALAKRLDLHEPAISWHVSRDRIAMLATALASLLGSLAKMAVDIAFMMSTEVQELREPAAKGRGSSSTMPQKRNPVMCEAIIEAARDVQHVPATILDAMLQEHERGIGHGYRERTAISNAICLVSGAVTLTKELLSGLEVDTARMRANLGATNGLIHSEAVMIYLSETFGRIKAHDILHEVSRKVILQGSDLETELASLGVEVPPDVLAEDGQIAHAYGMIDQVLNNGQYNRSMA